MLASGLAARYSGCLAAAHAYIERSQVQENCPDGARWYRHASKGAFPFSTRDHGWPISDCTAEGLKAALGCAEAGSGLAGPPIPAQRLCDCVNIILSYQNHGGGWATYENTRSYPALELLNPAETFGDIMIDSSYVECTSASIPALRAFGRRHPTHRTEEINRAIGDGAHFILRQQRPDGSWRAAPGRQTRDKPATAPSGGLPYARGRARRPRGRPLRAGAGTAPGACASPTAPGSESLASSAPA